MSGTPTAAETGGALTPTEAGGGGLTLGGAGSPLAPVQEPATEVGATGVDGGGGFMPAKLEGGAFAGSGGAFTGSGGATGTGGGTEAGSGGAFTGSGVADCGGGTGAGGRTEHGCAGSTGVGA